MIRRWKGYKSLIAVAAISLAIACVAHILSHHVGSILLAPTMFFCETALVWAVVAMFSTRFAERDSLNSKVKTVSTAKAIAVKVLLFLPLFYIAVGVYIDILVRSQGLMPLITNSIKDQGAMRIPLSEGFQIGWPITGAFGTEGSSKGHAELDVPVVESGHSFTAHIDAIKESGVWRVTNVSLPEQ